MVGLHFDAHRVLLPCRLKPLGRMVTWSLRPLPSRTTSCWCTKSPSL